MKLPHSIFIRQKRDEFPGAFTAMGKIISPCISMNIFINIKLVKMTLKLKLAGVLF